MTDSLIPYSFVPGTKAKASEVNANFIAVAEAINSSNSSITDLTTEMNTSIAGRLDLNMSNAKTVTNCIVSAPNGVISYSGLTITAQTGLKVLMPNGTNSDGSLKNTVYTTSTNISTTDNTSYGERFIAIVSNGSLLFFYKNCYLTGKISDRPTTLANTNNYIYFAYDTNKMYKTSGSTTANWAEIQLCIIGEYTVTNSAISQFYAYNCLNLTNNPNLSLSNLDDSSIHNVLKPQNKAMLISEAKKVATIGTRGYYKSYNDECICGIVTFTNGYSAPMFVSNIARGATGYDDHDTNPRTSGTIIWKGKLWHYMVGYPASLSSGLTKLCNIPLIAGVESISADLAIKLLETYYSSVTYSMPFINGINGNNWYRIWGDGWIEQGGITSTTASVNLTFLKPFSNTNYTALAIKNGNTSDTRSTILIENKNTTGMTLTSSDARVKNWYACGY